MVTDQPNCMYCKSMILMAYERYYNIIKNIVNCTRIYFIIFRKYSFNKHENIHKKMKQTNRNDTSDNVDIICYEERRKVSWNLGNQLMVLVIS